MTNEEVRSANVLWRGFKRGKDIKAFHQPLVPSHFNILDPKVNDMSSCKVLETLDGGELGSIGEGVVTIKKALFKELLNTLEEHLDEVHGDAMSTCFHDFHILTIASTTAH